MDIETTDLVMPSQLYQAIDEEIKRRVRVTTAGYEEFGEVELNDALVLIEFEADRTGSGQDGVIRSPDGRLGYRYDITLHGVVSRARKHAGLEVINLAASLKYVVVDNIWGLPQQQVKRPELMDSEPSIVKPGDDGYLAWAVPFRQTAYLGGSLLEDDPIVKRVFLAVNPDDPADVNEYREVGNSA